MIRLLLAVLCLSAVHLDRTGIESVDWIADDGLVMIGPSASVLPGAWQREICVWVQGDPTATLRELVRAHGGVLAWVPVRLLRVEHGGNTLWLECQASETDWQTREVVRLRFDNIRVPVDQRCDCDHDGDVDMGDFGVVQRRECDLDGDLDSDLDDIELFDALTRYRLR